MCCIFSTLLLLGPRAGLAIWWFFNPVYFRLVFATWIWPLLGILFAPWTALMYAIIAPGGVVGFDWLWLGLAVLADLTTYGGSAYGNRDRIPGYSA
jgi:hypothetical protein